MPKVINITARLKLLSEVKELWRENSKTLGPFPDGAFNEYAEKGWINIALMQDKCVGYLLFREVQSRNEIIIVHLCVSSKYRKKGIAKALLYFLKKNTISWKGIGLWCRNDYNASSFWSHLGFVTWKERKGRGKDGARLDYWWFDHRQKDLFSSSRESSRNDRLQTAIDANIFYDLEGTDTEDASESLGLAADWLQPQVDLLVTTELLNEISRNTNSAEREEQRIRFHKYRAVEDDGGKYQEIISLLSINLPPSRSEQDESDRRHIARCVSAGVDYFLTRDENLLNYSANIYDLTGLSVLRPCELISRIDGILREKDYQPKRLMGLAVFSVERDTDAAEKLAREFLSNSKGERLKDLKQTIINIATNPRNSTIHTIKEINSKKIGLLCCRINSNDEWQIDICRVREVKGVKSKTLSSTLLDLAIRQSISRKISVCFFKDNFANDEIINILYGLGFKSTVNGWVKINIENILSVCDLDRYFKKIKSSSNYVKKVINQYIDNVTNAKDNNDCNSLINIERDLRPLKFFDVEFPVYIVPIQSVWASMLFDHKLASLELFTEKPDLIMNRSNVYYRSSRPCNISAPGRILWYVKQDNKRMGTKAIRAFSYLGQL